MEYFIYACLALFVIINVLAWKQSGGMVKISSFGKRTFQVPEVFGFAQGCKPALQAKRRRPSCPWHAV